MAKNTKVSTKAKRLEVIQKQRLIKDLVQKEANFREISIEHSKLKGALAGAEESLKEHQQLSHGPIINRGDRISISSESHEEQRITEQLTALVDDTRKGFNDILPIYFSKKQEIESLREELKKSLQITPADILAIQSEVEGLSDRVAEIRSAIQTNEQKLFQDSEACRRYNQLCREQEDLLAKLELNEAQQEELDAFEQEIREQRALSEEFKSSLQQKLSGLKRMFADVEKSKSELEFIANEFTTIYLLNEAEHAASKYLEAATALENQFKEILGIQGALEILKPRRGNINIIGNEYHEIQIPAFALDAFQGKETRESGHLFDGTGMDSVEESCKEYMLEKLKKEGVVILSE